MNVDPLAAAEAVAVQHRPEWDHEQRRLVCAADRRVFPCPCRVNAIALIECACPGGRGWITAAA